MRTNQPEKAETDATAALAMDESAAAAWLVLGQSFELQGKRKEAMDAYEQAGKTAEANGDDEIVVIARMSLGRMMGDISPELQ